MSFCDEHGTADSCPECVREKANREIEELNHKIQRLAEERDHLLEESRQWDKESLVEIVKERDGLRAQLARCVEALREIVRPRTLDEWNGFDREDFISKTLEALQKTAALDANVLRCADKFEETFDVGSCATCGEPLYATSEDEKLCSAVRAAKEARK